MAITLTKNYQLISTIYLTYGEIRTYAKYTSQSIENNETYVNVQSRYNVYVGTVSFDSWYNQLKIGDGDTIGTGGGYATLYAGETTMLEVGGKIKHNNDGTAIETTITNWWEASYGGTGHTSAKVLAPKINRYPELTSGSDFTDKTNPVYTITAYGTYPIRAKIEAGGNTQLITRDLSSQTSQTYTFELTSQERKTLRNLSSDGKTLAVREAVCAMNGSTELSSSYKDYTMTITSRPFKLRVNGEFVDAIPYVRVNNEWKEAEAYVRTNNEWKEGI